MTRKRYDQESPVVQRAKQLLAEAEAGRRAASGLPPINADGKPTGVTTVSDLIAAEANLAQKQAELRAYQASDDGETEGLDAKTGARSLHVADYRYEKTEHLRQAVDGAMAHLQNVKRQWLGDIVRKDMP